MGDAQTIAWTMEVRKFKLLFEVEMNWLHDKLRSIEMRISEDHMLGSEAVRMFELIALHLKLDADPRLLLAQLRHIGCKYVRALSRSYPTMRSEEKLMLMRFLFFVVGFAICLNEFS